MNAQSKIEPAGLSLLRAPFAENHISKLPKEMKWQIDERKERKNCINCEICGGWHHKGAVHLDYVGHAALTDRLLDTDLTWSWEPVAFNDHGLPAFDQNGGLWIKLTVLGVTRLGYGAADGKRGGDAVKEIIGDALRNAAMRFGAALDLWHKGDLHLEEQTESGPGGDNSEARQVSPTGAAEPAQEQAKPRNWGGRYPTKTALHRGLIVHQAELNRLGVEGTFDDLDMYLTSPEYQDFIKQAGDHAPHYLDGPRPEGVPPEFIQTFDLETKARDMIALRGNVPADMENTDG